MRYGWGRWKLQLKKAADRRIGRNFGWIQSTPTCYSAFMEGFDADWCLEIISDLLERKGKVVFTNEWDSGGPSAGAGVERVVYWNKLYWAESSTFGYSGPFESLEEAASGNVGAITDATTEVDAPSLSMKKLLSLLWVQHREEKPFQINGKEFKVSDEGKIIKAI